MTEHSAENDAPPRRLLHALNLRGIYLAQDCHHCTPTGGMASLSPSRKECHAMGTATSLDELLDVLALEVLNTGRTQTSLARDAGFSQKHVSQMLSGVVDGSLRAWSRLLDAAGLEVRIVVTTRSVE